MRASDFLGDFLLRETSTPQISDEIGNIHKQINITSVIDQSNTYVIHKGDFMSGMPFKTDLSSLAARLLHARNFRGLTQADLATRAGVSQGTIGNAEAGTRKQPRDIFKIAQALDVEYEWLVTGEGHSGLGGESTKPANASQKVFVTKISGAHLSAGNGEVLYDIEQLDDSHAFKRDWMIKQSLETKHCRLWDVRGDSMWPTIPSGSTVLINSAQREPVSGKIFALITEDGLRLKRLIRRADGIWELHSDNPLKTEYPTETFEASTTAILGRVRWSAVTH